MVSFVEYSRMCAVNWVDWQSALNRLTPELAANS